MSETGSVSVTNDIADFIVGVRFDQIPAEVVAKAKEQIVFFFGRAFEGYGCREGIEAREALHDVGPSEYNATLIADRTRLSPSNAAFANCSFMRGSQRDDVIWPSGIHAGVITLPPALAMGEVNHASGQELLVALIVGYEVLGKLGGVAQAWEAAQPRRPTNIFGAYGPITVASRLLRLDRERTANALGYAANLAIGIPEGGMMDHYYSLICRNATFAAQLAEAGGVPYSTTTIEGPTGLYRSFYGTVPPGLSRAIKGLGSDWEILRAEQKRHPGTGQNTVAIELLLELMHTEKFMANDVQRIDAFQPFPKDSPVRKNAVASRGPFKKPVDAYSSLPYALAHVLLEGKVALRWYDDTADYDVINDRTVAAVMQKIFLSYEDGHSSSRYCRIEVHLRDARKFVRVAEDFVVTLPMARWDDWLQEHGRVLLNLDQLRQLGKQVEGLATLDDVGKMMSLVVPRSS